MPPELTTRQRPRWPTHTAATVQLRTAQLWFCRPESVQPPAVSGRSGRGASYHFHFSYNLSYHSSYHFSCHFSYHSAYHVSYHFSHHFSYNFSYRLPYHFSYNFSYVSYRFLPSPPALGTGVGSHSLSARSLLQSARSLRQSACKQPASHHWR